MHKRRNGHRHERKHGRDPDRDLAGPWSGVGRTWMKVGLNMGKVALETSMETLRTAADTLDKLSRAADEGRVPPCCVEPPPGKDAADGTERRNGAADTDEETDADGTPGGEKTP